MNESMHFSSYTMVKSGPMRPDEDTTKRARASAAVINSSMISLICLRLLLSTTHSRHAIVKSKGVEEMLVGMYVCRYCMYLDSPAARPRVDRLHKKCATYAKN